jgi:hypothetical protein
MLNAGSLDPHTRSYFLLHLFTLVRQTFPSFPHHLKCFLRPRIERTSFLQPLDSSFLGLISFTPRQTTSESKIPIVSAFSNTISLHSGSSLQHRTASSVLPNHLHHRPLAFDEELKLSKHLEHKVTIVLAPSTHSRLQGPHELRCSK